MRAEQTLNPEAWYENLGYLPEGSGERTQVSLEVYNNNGVAKEK
ncbi:putative lipoprotein [Vibrio parahaemolyticus VP250]|nr:putative lipoprotein [Vibrio parahaemolyticus VP250]